MAISKRPSHTHGRQKLKSTRDSYVYGMLAELRQIAEATKEADKKAKKQKQSMR